MSGFFYRSNSNAKRKGSKLLNVNVRRKSNVSSSSESWIKFKRIRTTRNNRQNRQTNDPRKIPGDLYHPDNN